MKVEIKKLILDILNNSDLEITPGFVTEKKKEFSKKNKLKSIPTNMELLSAYNELLEKWEIEENLSLRNSLRKRWVRSQSGIVPVQVLTKPWPCPGRCIFCPDDATMPKSYINTEPWAMRALLNQFDPIKQVYNRLLSLSMTWHDIDKIEMIVLWWTWDSYPNEYKEWFIKSLFDACNTFFEFKEKSKNYNNENNSWEFKKNVTKGYFKAETNIENMDIKYSKDIHEAQSINENSQCRIIWLTVETRPEFVNDTNCKLWRKLWVTRLEIWIQNLYNSVLKANDRWNNVQQSRDALHKLRQYWFKFSCHFMPGLYKSSIQKDIKTMEKAYSDKCLKPDEIKFYPTSVIANTRLYDLWKSWEYKPLSTEDIKYITQKVQLDIVPAYSRIKRLIRDIPETEIAAWSNLTNLRQIVMNEMDSKFRKNDDIREEHYKRLYPNMKLAKTFEEFLSKEKSFSKREKTYIISWEPDLKSVRNFVAIDTRSREIINKKNNEWMDFMLVRKYTSSVWQEYFISFEDEFWYLYWFARLLLPESENTIDWDWLWENTALIRELHVYGKLTKINKKISDSFQHTWFWSRLMEASERLSKQKWYDKISVISWVWVRWYYRKLWYDLEWTYMTKKL